MKDLSTYFECDGAATPSTVMGMGNPAAPDGEVPGSGDTFDHQKTAKSKRRKKDVRTTDKKHQEDIVQPATEGLLDVDFGMDDSFDSAIIGTMIDKYAGICNNDIKLNESQYNDFYEQFRSVAKSMHSQFAEVSLMRAFRSKDYTIISFKKKTACLTKGSMIYENGIEIRRFVKNPLPWAIEVAWSKGGGYVAVNTSQRTNHPTTMNIKLWEAYIVPADIWDRLQDKLTYRKMS